MDHASNSSSKGPLPVIHIRRCHICGNVNEAKDSAVHQCAHCGKHLAPFYYFDESKLEGLEVQGLFLSVWKQVVQMSPGTFHPIWGLSTYWQEQESNEGHSGRYS